MTKQESKDYKKYKDSWYKLNRLMSRLKVNREDLEIQYEEACQEVGRLQGLEEGLNIIQRITHD